MGKGGNRVTPEPVVTVFPTADNTEDFVYSNTDEPHISRRKQILAKHPEIEKLFVPDSRPVPYVVATVVVQLLFAYSAQYMSKSVFLFCAWLIGGGITHCLSLMTHEVSHNLVFKSNEANMYLGIFCNIGMGFPSSTMFKRYHMEHHQFQGDTARDVDLPTKPEGFVFRGPLLKAIFVLLQPLTYAIRPGVIRPKAYTKNEVINLFVVVISQIVNYYIGGPAALGYLALSLILGMSFHPLAGHLIAEHFMFAEGFETYSYYGPLNYFAWNVGYHNEHHDFPRVPGWRLPEVRRIAPEFYEDLPCHESWVMAIVKFIIDPNVKVFSRTKRTKGGD